MNASRVMISIDARDNASKVFEGLQSSIRGGVLQAVLLQGALTTALNAATGAAKGLFEVLGQAADTQNSILMASSGLMSATNMNLDQASGFMSKVTADLAKNAAALPGVTNDYVQVATNISDDLIQGFKDAAGNVDYSSFQKSLTNIATSTGVIIGTNSETTLRDANRALTSALSGTQTWKQLMGLDFFVKNSPVRNAIQKELDKTGKDFTDMTSSEIAALLEKTLKIDPSVQAKLEKSLSGRWQGFISAINDPLTGLFGGLRELPSVLGGASNAIEGLENLATAVLGPYGLVSSLSDLFNALGLNFDPMLTLRDGAVKLAEGIRIYLVEPIRDISKSIKQGIPTDLSGRFNDIFESILEQGKGMFSGLGVALKNTLEGYWKLISAIDWNMLGYQIGGMLASLTNELSFVLANADWNSYLDAIGKVFVGLGVGMLSFLSKVDWGLLLLGVGRFLGAILGKLIQVQADAAGLLGKSIMDGIGTLADGLKRVLASLAADLADSIYKSVTWLQGKWGEVRSAIGEMFSKILSWVRSLPGIGQLVPPSRPQTGTIGTIGNLRETTPRPSQSMAIGSRAKGQPGLLSGLLQAAQKETAAMPSGAGLVLANTSEAILNQQQQRALMGARNGVQINAPMTFQVSFSGTLGTEQEQAMYGRFCAYVQDEFNRFTRSKMTAIA